VQVSLQRRKGLGNITALALSVVRCLFVVVESVFFFCTALLANKREYFVTLFGTGDTSIKGY
jgi:hypothetical protein